MAHRKGLHRRAALIGGGAAAASLALAPRVTAQVGRQRLVAALMAAGLTDPRGPEWAAAVREGLALEGWIDGGNARLEPRFTSAGPEASLAYAAELAAMRPDIFVCGTTRNTNNARNAAPGTPIVFVAVVDPVADGFVETFARPGGIITGISHVEYSVTGKWLDLLIGIAPGLREVGMIFNPDAAGTWDGLWAALLEATSGKGIQPTAILVRSLEEIGPAIDDLASRPNTGLIVPNNNYLHANQEVLLGAVDRNRLPTVWSGISYVEYGGIVGYATDITENFWLAGQYAGRILNGTAPSDLPVLLPRYVMIVNLRTAAAHGIAIPNTMLAVADVVIE